MTLAMRKSGFALLFVGVLSAAVAASPAPQAGDAPSGMALIPAGEFWMGRVHFFLVDAIGYFERDRQDDYPAHKVNVDAFYIDKYEVANEDYARFLEATRRNVPWHWPDGKIPKGEERFPIYNVNWEEADAYCKSAGKRLPTEAEWEKASRGGLDRKKFPWGDGELGMAGYEGERGATPPAKPVHSDSPHGPIAVGSHPPNGYGLHDVSGNVWEWVQDWYSRNYYSIGPSLNPRGPERGDYKVIRGGGWSDSDERSLMNHFRNYTDPELRASSIGFRCANSVAGE
ncbi:MAG: SUMF1/EgtB/PvdO family nonheme iron enzyme [Acidobacteria bacterium]|nr:SUMF1/EgtB/PvdO family nonheme iron enzyme [Acidobacteriota bacterium]